VANINPSGIDLITGQRKHLTPADTLTDSDGTALVSSNSIPTASSWTANTETLSGDKTLTDSSETIQFLDPNGVDRDVTLPVITTSTPQFLVVNTGSTNTLTIRNSADQPLSTISAGAAGRVWTDGVSVFTADAALTAPDTSVGKLLYNFGAIFDQQPTFAMAGGSFQAPDRNSGFIGPITDATMNVAGTIDLITYHMTSASSTVIRLYKNGASDTTFSGVSVTEGSFTPSTSVAAGDDVRIENVSGTLPGATHFQLYLTPSSGNLSSYSFGGDPILGGNLVANTISATSGSGATFTDREEQTIVEACTADSFAWNTDTGATNTSFKLYKNASFSETLPNLTGVVGSVSGLTTTFAALDTVTFEYDAGTDPGDGTYNFAVSGATGAYYKLGGDSSTGVSAFFNFNVVSGAVNATLGVGNEAVVPAGTISTMAVRSEFALDDFYELWKNGALSNGSSKGSAVAKSLISFAPVSFSTNDRFSIKDVSSNNSGDTNVVVLLELNA
jgi:hypothetical protein